MELKIVVTSNKTMCSLNCAELEVTRLECISNWSIIMWLVPFSLVGSGYDDILSVQLTWNKTLKIGRESRAGRSVRGSRMVSNFTCPSEIRCFYPNNFNNTGALMHRWKFETSKILNFWNSILKTYSMPTKYPLFKFKWSIVFRQTKNKSEKIL